MKFSDHLKEVNSNKSIDEGEIVKREDFDELDLPAFARNRGVTTTTKLSDEDFDPEDIEVAAYKRTSPDKGKSIEDEARKGSQQFKKPLAAGEKSKWDIERMQRSELAKQKEKLDQPYDIIDIVRDEDPDHINHYKAKTMTDLERIIRRIKNRNK